MPMVSEVINESGVTETEPVFTPGSLSVIMNR